MMERANQEAAWIPREHGILYPNVEDGLVVGRRGSKRVYHTDAVVIGSGAGGATAAAQLRDAGFEVLILEEGGLHRTETFRAEPISSAQKLYRDAGTSPILGRPPMLFAEGRCVGGSTVINGGMSWRTPERVLDHWQNGLGLERTDPRAMEPYFDRAERILNVEFQNEDTLGTHDRLFVEGARRLGWEIKDNPRNVARCVGLNNCAYGCPTGAKQSMLVTEIPRALAAGARLVTSARIWRLVFEGGRAVAARGRYVDNYGRRYGRFEVQAKLFVLAAGARFTPAILKRSFVRTRGIGRHLHTHPNAKVVGLFDQRMDPWRGAHQAHQIHQFLEEGILLAYAAVPPGLLAPGIPGFGRVHGDRMRLYNYMLTAGCLIEDAGEGRVKLGPDLQPIMRFDVGKEETERIHKGVRLLAELMFAVGARKVLLPFGGLQEISTPDELGKIDARRHVSKDLELMTVHIMSTCRMGADPSRGVTDAFGRLYGASNVVIADASVIASAIGVNPMETIVALALRNSERWAETLRG